MDGKTDDTAAIILQRISTAIEKTCDKRSMRPGLAANEAAAYLKINALFATICPVSNAVLVGCTTATFMYFIAPSPRQPCFPICRLGLPAYTTRRAGR